MFNLDELRKQCTVTDFENFEQHYTEIVNFIGLETLKEYMPCSIEVLKKQYNKGNIHFNCTSNRSNEPYCLKAWDRKAEILPVRNAIIAIYAYTYYIYIYI